MKKVTQVITLLIVLSTMIAACGGGAPEATDLLADIKQRGYILISTDPNYEPQSFLNTEGIRPSDTVCPSDALTPAEMQGFDVDVAVKIAEGLGVEACFATPDWDLITAGSWADKWDLSVGSMTIDLNRQKILDFSVPYYYTPAMVAALTESGLTSLDDLAGQSICVGSATTYEGWLVGTLAVPENQIYAQPPEGITVISLPTDQECPQTLMAGRRDFIAYVTSDTVINANIAAGMPMSKIGKSVFSENLAAAVDKSSSLPTSTLLNEVDTIIAGMHADGTLSALSMKWFGEDLTLDPSK